MSDVVSFPKAKRPPKAICVTKVAAQWWSVCILPQGPRDAEMFGVFADGVDFGDYRSAIISAIDAYEAFGQAAGLLLVDDARQRGEMS